MPPRDATGGAAQVEAHLERALAAAERDTWVEATDHLIEAWRARPSTRVGDLVIAIDANVPARPIVAGTIREREQLWLEAARAPEDLVLRSLFATPWPAHPKAARRRIEALAMRTPSPRIGHGLLELHQRREYQTSSGPMVSRDSLRVMLAHGDPQVTRYLSDLEVDFESHDVTLRSTIRPVLGRRRPIDPEPSAREAELLAALAARIPSATELGPRRAALLEAIYAAPFDDGPREVLADLLTEHDDPRGELITLQLRRASGAARAREVARERALLRESGSLWSDGLDKDGAEDIDFGRGFPVAATLKRGNFAAPAWATIEDLRLDRYAPPFRGSPSLRALRRLYGLAAGQLAHVALVEPELEVLVVHGTDALDVETPIAPRCLGFARLPFDAAARLREIQASLPELLQAPFGRRIEELHLAVRIDQLPIAFAILAETPRLVSVTLTGDYDSFGYDHMLWFAHITRSHMRIEWHSAKQAGRRDLDTLASTLKRTTLPVQSVEIVESESIPVRERERVRNDITAALEAWPATKTIL